MAAFGYRGELGMYDKTISFFLLSIGLTKNNMWHFDNDKPLPKFCGSALLSPHS